MPSLTCISSMATRALLVDLMRAYEARGGCPVALSSIAGVRAFERVSSGEAFDLVVLADDAIDKLVQAGRLHADSRCDIARSGIAIGVRAGAEAPDVSTAEAVRQAVLAAPSIGISTGPSGVRLAALFRRWGIEMQLKDRLVTAPPGVPVASLLASGSVALGFQQLPEMMNVEGVQIIGSLPNEIAIVTTFSAAVCVASSQPVEAGALLRFLASGDVAKAKLRHGMEPA